MSITEFADKAIAAAATIWRVTEDDIRSKDRHQPVAFARQVAMVVTIEVTGASNVKVAKVFGKNVSTVWHARNQVADIRSVDQKESARLDAMRELLNAI